MSYFEFWDFAPRASFLGAREYVSQKIHEERGTFQDHRESVAKRWNAIYKAQLTGSFGTYLEYGGRAASPMKSFGGEPSRNQSALPSTGESSAGWAIAYGSRNRV